MAQRTAQESEQDALNKFLSLAKEKKIKRIIVHDNPDLDAKIAIWLMKKALGEDIEVLTIPKGGNWSAGDIHLDVGERKLEAFRTLDTLKPSICELLRNIGFDKLYAYNKQGSDTWKGFLSLMRYFKFTPIWGNSTGWILMEYDNGRRT